MSGFRGVNRKGADRLKIPERFQSVTMNRSLLLVRSDLEERALEAGLLEFADPRLWQGAAGSIVGGRGTLMRLRLPGDPEITILVKLMKRGGIYSLINRQLHLSMSRLFRQARLSRFLERHGVPSAEMLFGRAERLAGPFYRLHMGTMEAPNTRPLLEILEEEHDSPSRGRSRESALAAFHDSGQLIRALHEAGVLHADLNLSNILVTGRDAGSEEPRARIIDLDGSRLPPVGAAGPLVPLRTLSDARRAGNLARFLRHAVKSGLLDGTGFSELWDSFLKGYCRDGGIEEMNRRVIRKYRATLPFHSVSWRLQGVRVPLDPFRS